MRGLPRPNVPHAFVLALFAVATGVNAALLFAVEPMFTKMVLPLLGGTPSVWNTCLLFFQAALLLGYLYAHITSRLLSTHAQGLLHIALLLVSLTFLPIGVARGMSPPAGTSFPIPWLLLLLTVSLGLPFLLLSAGAPMFQRWFATTLDSSAGNPYVLYVASNIGSFVALIAYPALIEPRMRLSEQSVTWLEVYYGMIGLVAVCAIVVWRWGRGRGNQRPTDSPRNGTGGVETMMHPDLATAIVETGGAPRPVLDRGTPLSPPDSARAVPEPGGALEPNPERVAESDREPHPEPDPGEPPPVATDATMPSIEPNNAWRLRWVLLSFAPSSLLLGVTTFLSTDVASVPFLWVVPLALYLLTFVIVFARRPLLGRRFMLVLQLLLGLALMIVISANPSRSLTTFGLLHLVTFFCTAMVCHRELADSRPRAEHLTEYYFWLSLGGLLGGVFNVILAPLLYNQVLEYPFAMIVAFGLRPGRRGETMTRGKLLLDLILPIVLFIAIISGYKLPSPPAQWGTYAIFAYLGIAGLAAASFWKRPLRLALGAAAIFFGTWTGAASDKDVLFQQRSFFGVYRVRDFGEYHILQHGTTTHGGQSMVAARRTEPLTYYHRDGPLGDVFAAITDSVRPRSVAIVGLGTGTTSCYSRPGEQWTVFEIDPLVVRIARTPALFTYLRDCAPNIRIVLGDARLSIGAAADSSFDLIVLDAFSSDAIPVHLITREALQLYLRKLRPNGAVLFHISNRYLDLRPVLAELARDAHVAGALGDRDVNSAERDQLWYGSRWVALARDAATLAPLVKERGWSVLAPSAGVRVWTDDFSDVLGVMKWR